LASPFDARAEFAYRFLSGEGLEIGTSRRPLQVAPRTRVRQVDPGAEEAPEVASGSQDFIVDDRPVEDLGAALADHLDKLKPGGVLLLTVPDLRPLLDLDEGLEVEASARGEAGTLVVLRKPGAPPRPAGNPSTAPELAAELASLRSRVAQLEAASRELERVKRSNSWRVTEPLRAAKARLVRSDRLAR
jgi:hypothetical protein